MLLVIGYKKRQNTCLGVYSALQDASVCFVGLLSWTTTLPGVMLYVQRMQDNMCNTIKVTTCNDYENVILKRK